MTRRRHNPTGQDQAYHASGHLAHGIPAPARSGLQRRQHAFTCVDGVVAVHGLLLFRGVLVCRILPIAGREVLCGIVGHVRSLLLEALIVLHFLQGSSESFFSFLAPGLRLCTLLPGELLGRLLSSLLVGEIVVRRRLPGKNLCLRWPRRGRGLRRRLRPRRRRWLIHLILLLLRSKIERPRGRDWQDSLLSKRLDGLRGRDRLLGLLLILRLPRTCLGIEQFASER